jgi:hypothetical protein
MTDATYSKVAMTPGFQPYDSKEKIDIPYIEIIGSIGYLAKTTRPDIAFAYSFLGRFSKKPNEAVWNEAKRVLRYLNYTKDVKLTYNVRNCSTSKITSYCDASFANCEDNFSTTGYVIFFNGNLIQWKSKKQKVPSASTTVAEIYSLIECLKECIYLKEMINELIQETIELEIYCDNKATIAIASNEIVNGKSKYILSKIALLRHHLKAGTYKLMYVPTRKNLADILTKSANAKVFKEHVQLLGLSGLLKPRPDIVSDTNIKTDEKNPQTVHLKEKT